MNTPLDKARSKFEKKRKLKPISFNIETELDLFKAANAMPDFSKWVKEKLKETIK